MIIRVVLPYHLRNLAKVEEEVQLDISDEPTIGAVLDALESRYPVLRGTIREYGTLKRRAFIRFFACKEDMSHDSADTLLPAQITSGEEPFMIVGAMAGG